MIRYDFPLRVRLHWMMRMNVLSVYAIKINTLCSIRRETREGRENNGGGGKADGSHNVTPGCLRSLSVSFSLLSYLLRIYGSRITRRVKPNKHLVAIGPIEPY